MLGVRRAELPPPPPVLDPGELHERLTELLTRAMNREQHLYVATDGSADLRTAAFAIVIPSIEAAFATGVDSEDQSPFRAEVEALAFLFRAALHAFRAGMPITK